MTNPTGPDEDVREPVWSAGALTATVTAILALVVAFGLPLTAAQEAAILGVAAVVAPLVAAWAGRRRAYAPATVAQLLRQVRTETRSAGGNGS